MNVEQLLTERIGDFRQASLPPAVREGTDRVALDMRACTSRRRSRGDHPADPWLYMKALTVKSRENLDAVMPGYTHLQRT